MRQGQEDLNARIKKIESHLQSTQETHKQQTDNRKDDISIFHTVPGHSYMTPDLGSKFPKKRHHDTLQKFENKQKKKKKKKKKGCFSNTT